MDKAVSIKRRLAAMKEFHHAGVRTICFISYAAGIGLDYVTNDDSMSRPFHAPPVIVNYFYHSEIKKSARKDGAKNA